MKLIISLTLLLLVFPSTALGQEIQSIPVITDVISENFEYEDLPEIVLINSVDNLERTVNDDPSIHQEPEAIIWSNIKIFLKNMRNIFLGKSGVNEKIKNLHEKEKLP